MKPTYSTLRFSCGFRGLPMRFSLSLFLLSMSIILLTGWFTSCQSSHKDVIPTGKFAPYINAYSGGVLSQESTIRIELTQDIPMVDLNNEIKENPFHFSPSLAGKAYWKNNHTLEFVPAKGALQPGTLYHGSFQLSDWVKVEDALKEFKFSFRVQELNFALRMEPIRISANEPERVNLKGTLSLSDNIPQNIVEKMISAQMENTSLPVKVTPTNQKTRYIISIERVPRQDKDKRITLTMDGHTAAIKQIQKEEIIIPAKHDFRFLSAERISEPENGIEVVFSSPVSIIQDLKGLIEIKELPHAITQVNDNRIRIFFDTTNLENLNLLIHEGIQDYQSQTLNQTHTLSFGELAIKPQVKMEVEAAILPDSKKLLIPFQAVNLYAVDLQVIRIYERNVLTFLQSNTMKTAHELRRSGRMVYQKTLWLAKDSSKDIHQWETYTVDLAGLIRQEPGAIYRVLLSFRPEYSAYPCGNTLPQEISIAQDTQEMMPVAETGLTEKEEAIWDIPQPYYYTTGNIDWSVYKWSERDNPCHPSYYMNSERIAECNVFASNIGLLVKKNAQHDLWITVNNLLTTDPIPHAKVSVFNYQLQCIAEGITDKNGWINLKPQGVPFIVMAEKEKQKAYVRVVDGEALSVSRFDVGGKKVQKGLKGFIYGERGVWRPGDTLHLSFFLEDRAQRIPDTHPVTLELYSPKGQFYTKMMARNSKNGCYTFPLPTQPDIPTGTWNAYVKVGGTAFHKSLRIETIKPNRLKIALTLPNLLVAKEQWEVPLTAAWLTGATASGLKTKVEIKLNKVHTQFKGLERYVFNNPATDFTSMETNVFEGKLNAQGNTTFKLKLPEATHAPGMLNASFMTRVFEPGGDASFFVQQVPFSPFKAYVGIDLHQPKDGAIETDKDHIFEVVTVNPKGQLVNRSNLEYKIYKIDWSWWWENQPESLGNYIHNHSMIPVAQGILKTTKGKTSFRFRVDYPAWGRYLVFVKDKESGHATGGIVYIDWPEWRGRSIKKDPNGLQMLSFSLDKETYEIGDKATVIIPAAGEGRALISIENGSTLLKQEWIQVTQQNDTRYSFSITPEMAPNVYIHITLLQPHAQGINDLPVRLYGVVPVHVTNKQTVLHPQINMPASLRPETNFQVTVSEEQGRCMTYTLAIVDEGLLNLTHYQTPNPWNEFYAREALGIDTWDMYDHVLGATTGAYSALFSTGGDAMLKPADAKVNRFKPVVKFLGPFVLNKGEKQTHTLQLPMYVGAVRTMVVAGQDGAYGCAEKTVQVRTPLMLVPTLPRVLSTQEEICIPVNIFAMDSRLKNVQLHCSIHNKSHNSQKESKEKSNNTAQSSANIKIIGHTLKSISFKEPGDQLAFFTIQTGSHTGKAVIRFTAKANGLQTQEEIEIEVRNPNPVVTLRQSQWIEAGQSKTFHYKPNETSTAHNATGNTKNNNRVTLEVSRIPSVDFTRRWKFLSHYPHACTEQLTSKALPLLFVSQLKEVNPIEHKAIKAQLTETIRQLYSRQLANGGFVYWPGNAVADEWVSSYVGLFLSLAKEKGYAIHEQVLNKWKRFQRTAAQNWSANPPASRASQQFTHNQRISEHLQAFRLYTLAVANAPEYGAMNRMKEQKELSIQASWQLAATYALTGKRKPAEELIFGKERSIAPYPTFCTGYGSAPLDEAIILETLLLMNRKQEALAQAQKVSTQLAQEDRFNTQHTAWALMAMAQLAEQTTEALQFDWSWNGQPQPTVTSAKAIFEKELNDKSMIAPTDNNQIQSGTVTIQNKSKGAICADLITRMQLLNDTLPAIQHNLKLKVRYTQLGGEPLEITQLKQGTDFLAIVTVSHPLVSMKNTRSTTTEDYHHLALTHILPSGWEIINERMTAEEQQTVEEKGIKTSQPFTYQDIRDDRVLTYFDLKQGESKSFVIRLQATYCGQFILPAIQCEAMYAPHILARTQAGRTEVYK